MPRTYTIYWDINGRKAYDASGTELANANIPYIGYKEKINLILQLIQSSDITDKFTGLSGDTITCEAAVDDDFILYYEGTLTEARKDAVADIMLSGVSNPDIYNTGSLYLENDAGENETVAYTEYSLSDGVYTFTVSTTLTYDYSAGDICRLIAQPLIAADNSDIDQTDKTTGKFIVSLYAFTAPYQRAINGKWEINSCKFGFYAVAAGGEDLMGCVFPIKCYSRLVDVLTIPPEP